MSKDFKEQIYDALADREKMIRAGKNSYPEPLIKMAETCAKAISQGRKILICGNGGSAADSQHFAAELVVRLSSKVERAALPCIALTTDTSILTACANDYGYDMIFSRQVEALGKKGDALIGLSTSGNSENVLRAFKTADLKKMKSLGLLGAGGGKCKDICDQVIVIPSDSTMRIQEEHIFILHTLASLIEQILREEA